MWWTHRGDPIPEDWAERAPQLVTWFESMVDEEQVRIGELANRLLTEKRWEASQGFDLTDDIRLTIALQASLLILGLSFDHYRMVKSIVVHPSTLVLHGEWAVPGGMATDTPRPVLGVTQHDGPVVIAWDEAKRNARHPERGFDVVFHEFAHKLDMLDHVVDGTPPLDTQAQHDRWVEVCTAEFEAVRRGGNGHLLWEYAGQDPGEFFAVVTEVFFDRARDLRHHNADLYDVLSGFYNQDPAAQPD